MQYNTQTSYKHCSNIVLMQHLVNELIVKCHTNLNLFAENVIRMLTLLATSSEPDVAAAAAETVSLP
ncbi:hypothetical protein K450DRAFT_256486 [Umbelopsis ramanniana AG]|uniref:Uncharacterized protein n=1 Tax=Umbelopsis ramanniana AG TaxID=1314678 RepID=A0AAD5E6E5_UMBRA|nr:uncharacterized protein K450DRAFT_256486 [Umbelopsis ramanniana AG]KAI8576505.1 hypothetical protein K450DRAFT_256486 [Umbelopsis ramanniana AG]